MGTPKFLCSNEDDDDYIDIEMCSSDLFCYSISSPHQSRGFEFQMCSFSHNKETTTYSHADELFYKGKLLPLHLPPRLQMVQKLVQNPTPNSFDESFQVSPPLESCNISPSGSCRVSSEINPHDYFFELTVSYHPLMKSWTKRLKQSLLGQKLKASAAYLKSLFTKSSYSVDDLKYMNVPKESPFGESSAIKNIEKEMAAGDNFGYPCQRRSFSGATQPHSTTKSLSSSSGSSSSSSSFSFSSSSNGGLYDLQLLKGSISNTNKEAESSIEAAIAYCKKSFEEKEKQQ